MDFAIARAKPWKWLLALFGATEAHSTVHVDSSSLDVHFGPFHHRIAFRDISSIELKPTTLPWWVSGIGWRTNFAGRVALLGDAKNLVELKLSTPFRARLAAGLRVNCRELVLSMESPDTFVRAINTRRSHQN